jgi:hypothetical protein
MHRRTDQVIPKDVVIADCALLTEAEVASAPGYSPL